VSTDFGTLESARFLDRPNRFVVQCQNDRQGIFEAYLPNPGRLWELLLPEATLYLSGGQDEAGRRRGPRKTRQTVVAVLRDGAPVVLHTHWANRVAQQLIENRRIPGLRDAKVIRAEAPAGRSRFDFLLRQRGREFYLEVKSCTLFGNGVAMFPDAVTQRGRRHLIELASRSGKAGRAVVLFLVHTPRVQWFMPDYHTDLAFSETLMAVRKRLRILPVALDWKADLSLGSHIKVLEVPWDYLTREIQDRGSYLMLLRHGEDRHIEIGQLGSRLFRQGYYVYVGSAMRNLSARMARHGRKRKKLHWHIDYLGQHAEAIAGLPIRSSQRQECAIAGALTEVMKVGLTGFGSSDCTCAGHLFFSPGNPLKSGPFHEVLQRFRMGKPE
jgi:sugar fermentation stimulation protein A